MWRIASTLAYATMLAWIVCSANAARGGWFFDQVHRVPGGDKVAHFLLVGTMALLLNVCLRRNRFSIGGPTLLTGSVIVFCVATAEEISQIWIPARRFDVWDWVANTSGILLLGPLAVRRRKGVANEVPSIIPGSS